MFACVCVRVRACVCSFFLCHSVQPNYTSDVACQSFVAITTFEMAERLLAAHPQQRDFKFVEQTRTYLADIEQQLAAAFIELVQPMLSANAAGNESASASAPEPVYVKAQRWGGAFYSNEFGGERGEGGSPAPSFLNEAKRLALCGDFCDPGVSTAESAMLSGLSCGERLANLL